MFLISNVGIFNVEGHPFYISTSANDSSTNIHSTATNEISIDNNILTFIPSNVRNLFYNCNLHTGMVGNIIITDTKFTLSLPTSADTLIGLQTEDTLTNKTLTTPIVASIQSSTGKTLTLPDVTDTVVTKTTEDTLTNKTLTTPVMQVFNHPREKHLLYLM